MMLSAAAWWLLSLPAVGTKVLPPYLTMPDSAVRAPETSPHGQRRTNSFSGIGDGTGERSGRSGLAALNASPDRVFGQPVLQACTEMCFGAWTAMSTDIHLTYVEPK